MRTVQSLESFTDEGVDGRSIVRGASKLLAEVEGLSPVHLSLPHDRRVARLVGCGRR